MPTAALQAVAPVTSSTPKVQWHQRRSRTRTYAGGKKNFEHKRRRKKRAATGKQEGANSNGATPTRPKKLPLVTGPPTIRTERVIQPVAPALDPWWSTFVGHVEGVWAGKCAAFNLADGKMEPMMIAGDNVKIKELHTRVIEAVRFLRFPLLLLRA
jgi:hypothetical protein